MKETNKYMKTILMIFPKKLPVEPKWTILVMVDCNNFLKNFLHSEISQEVDQHYINAFAKKIFFLW